MSGVCTAFVMISFLGIAIAAIALEVITDRRDEMLHKDIEALERRVARLERHEGCKDEIH